MSTERSQRAMLDDERTSIDDAIRAWEDKGPTSLTVALSADALYGAREQRDEAISLMCDLLRRTPSAGEDSGGFILGYVMPTGPVHRIAAFVTKHGQSFPQARSWAEAKDARRDAEGEVVRLTRLLEQRTAALTRTIDAKNTAEAKVAAVRDLSHTWDDKADDAEEHGHDAAARATRFDAQELRALLDSACNTPDGCCDSCDGGMRFGGEMCWDCRGTGHPHPLDGGQP